LLAAFSEAAAEIPWKAKVSANKTKTKQNQRWCAHTGGARSSIERDSKDLLFFAEMKDNETGCLACMSSVCAIEEKFPPNKQSHDFRMPTLRSFTSSEY
jgi:hypothetical protein